MVSLYRLGFPQTNSGSSSSINTSSTAKKNTTATSGNNISPNGEGFLVTPYLRILEIAMQEDKDNLIEKVRGTYGFRVTHGWSHNISKILIIHYFYFEKKKLISFRSKWTTRFLDYKCQNWKRFCYLRRQRETRCYVYNQGY